MDKKKIRDLVSKMTLEEKAGICSGADFWHLKGIERLGIPQVMVTDGPHGIRKQAQGADHLGINESEKAICFPAGCAVAASFDRNLIRKLGETIGSECQAMDVSTILGPAINIKRSPLCGRNFEYYSEDPYVSTEMAAAMIEGVQSRNVGTSVKHFLANNQEKRRMTNSSDMDERTLREIYLASFEGAVKKAKPWTVMSSYNRINGEYVGDSKEYLTDILRNEWGFDGYVVSDWGAVNDRVKALSAGLDLEMPPGNFENDELIIKAVKEGKLDESILDLTCERIIDVIFRYVENRKTDSVFDYENDHRTAAEIEAECMVLLKNDNNILPLEEGKKVAFIGKYAREPRYQGGGSSHINSWKVEAALDAANEFPQFKGITFAEGYRDDKDETDAELLNEAVKVAKEVDVAVLFIGLPDNFESEGYDRKHLNLSNCQNELVEKILEVQKQVVVVLHNGAPVIMPWKDEVNGIIEAYLGGEAVGRATVEVLTGKKNPCGRLAETFPNRLEDTPCYLTYGKGFDNADYSEGVFVGYRHYTSRKIDTAFPFGYGLSYTTFEYSGLETDRKEMSDKETVNVSVKVKNTGNRSGKTVVQLYVEAPQTELVRPVRELRGFEKIFLEVGEEKTVTFSLDERAFAYWNTGIHDWYTEEGIYKIIIGENADKMCLSEEITVHSTKEIPKVYSLNTCLGELFSDPKAQAVMEPFKQGMAANQGAMDMAEGQRNDESGVVNQEMMAAMMEGMPLRQLLSFVPGMKREMLEQMVAALNSLNN